MPNTYSAVQAANAQAQPLPFNGGSNLMPGDSGPKAVIQTYDFGATGIPSTGYVTSLKQIINLGGLKGIQAIYIDNSLNDGPIAVASATFKQSLSLPAGYQGYFPIIAAYGSGNDFTITGPTATGICNIAFLNVLFPFALWPALVAPPSTGAPQAVSDAILDALVIASRFNVRSIDAGTTSVDHSGTITAGGTSQQLLAANANRRGYRIQNIDSAFQADGLWICETGVAVVGAAGSFCIAACASAGYPGGEYDGTHTGAVQIIGANTGHQFTCIEW